MCRIALLTTSSTVRQAVAPILSYLEEPIRFVEHINELHAVPPHLLLWYPARLDDQAAAQIVALCSNIIVITPLIPEKQRRLGGSYTSPWFAACPSLPAETFFAGMPLSPGDMACIIKHRLLLHT